MAAQIGCVEEGGAGGVEAFDEAVLEAAEGWGLDDGGRRDGEVRTEDASGTWLALCLSRINKPLNL